MLYDTCKDLKNYNFEKLQKYNIRKFSSNLYGFLFESVVTNTLEARGTNFWPILAFQKFFFLQNLIALERR